MSRVASCNKQRMSVMMLPAVKKNRPSCDPDDPEANPHDVRSDYDTNDGATEASSSRYMRSSRRSSQASEAALGLERDALDMVSSALP
eukprot:3058444-Prymnesium_polylepis.1